MILFITNDKVTEEHIEVNSLIGQTIIQMQERRRYKRFTIDIMEISGKMVLATYIKILDISIGGVSFKADRRLTIDREYALKIEGKEKPLMVKGTIVRAMLTESIKDQRGNIVPVYTAGMKFTEVEEQKVKEIAAFIENNLKHVNKDADIYSSSGRRQYLRVYIESPERSLLKFHESYRVKNIGRGGMLIESEFPLKIATVLPLEIFFNEDQSMKVSGKIISCSPIQSKESACYNIGIEFINMPEKVLKKLDNFILLLDKTDPDTPSFK